MVQGSDAAEETGTEVLEGTEAESQEIFERVDKMEKYAGDVSLYKGLVFWIL